MKYKLAFAFTVCIGLVISSCTKDDPAPAYVGTWVNISSFYSENQLIQTKDVVTFSSNTLIEKIQWKNSQTDKWVDYLGIKGSLVLQKDKMDISIKEAGVSSVDPITDEPTGEINYLKSTDSGFVNVMNEFGLPVNFDAQYSVAADGKEITLKKDITDDGDFLDEGEVKTYVRQ